MKAALIGVVAAIIVLVGGFFVYTSFLKPVTCESPAVIKSLSYEFSRIPGYEKQQLTPADLQGEMLVLTPRDGLLHCYGIFRVPGFLLGTGLDFTVTKGGQARIVEATRI